MIKNRKEYLLLFLISFCCFSASSTAKTTAELVAEIETAFKDDVPFDKTKRLFSILLAADAPQAQVIEETLSQIEENRFKKKYDHTQYNQEAIGVYFEGLQKFIDKPSDTDKNTALMVADAFARVCQNMLQKAIDTNNPELFDNLIFHFTHPKHFQVPNGSPAFKLLHVSKNVFSTALTQIIIQNSAERLQLFFITTTARAFSALRDYVVENSIAHNDTSLFSKICFINPYVFASWIRFNAKDYSPIEKLIKTDSLSHEALRYMLFAITNDRRSMFASDDAQNKIKLIDLLIKKGIDLNSTFDDSGDTAVHSAIRWLTPVTEEVIPNDLIKKKDESHRLLKDTHLEPLLTYFLKTKKFNPSIQNKRGETLASLAFEKAFTYKKMFPILVLEKNGIQIPAEDKRWIEQIIDKTKVATPRVEPEQIGISGQASFNSSNTSQSFQQRIVRNPTTAVATPSNASQNPAQQPTLIQQPNPGAAPSIPQSPEQHSTLLSTPAIATISIIAAAAVGKIIWEKYNRYKQKKSSKKEHVVDAQERPQFDDQR